MMWELIALTGTVLAGACYNFGIEFYCFSRDKKIPDILVKVTS